MADPEVAEVMVTVCGVAYVPGGGEKVGEAAVKVRAVVATALLAYPGATAMAWMVAAV